MLDEAQQQLLLRLTPSAFDDDRGDVGHRARPDLRPPGQQGEGARVRRLGPAGLSSSSFRPRPRTRSATCSSGSRWPTWDRRRRRSGRASAAWRSCRSAATPIVGPYLQHQLARIYLLVGEPEKALDQLEPLLKIPYYLSPGWLKIDPNFAPLRGNPRFERLVEGKT